jgi:hypothetical protein
VIVGIARVLGEIIQMLCALSRITSQAAMAEKNSANRVYLPCFLEQALVHAGGEAVKRQSVTAYHKVRAVP